MLWQIILQKSFNNLYFKVEKMTTYFFLQCNASSHWRCGLEIFFFKSVLFCTCLNEYKVGLPLELLTFLCSTVFKSVFELKRKAWFVVLRGSPSAVMWPLLSSVWWSVISSHSILTCTALPWRVGTVLETSLRLALPAFSR